MVNKAKRDDFPTTVVDRLARRASFICSNPSCRSLTIAASEADPDKYVYIGQAAHITSASPGGPRYDASLTPKDRSSIDNGIFLCANCATMIDKNGGEEYPRDLLDAWKSGHERWTHENLNKASHSAVAVLDGIHQARGTGRITGIDAHGPVFLKPGTRSTAEGFGTVTATRIGRDSEER
jgi:hypothetical protein